jgi:hypothetical protein
MRACAAPSIASGSHGNTPFSDGPDPLGDLHTFEITKEVGSDGYLVLRQHVVVSFRFRGVGQLRREPRATKQPRELKPPRATRASTTDVRLTNERRIVPRPQAP